MPLSLPNCSAYQCAWDSFHSFLTSRMLQDPLHSLCFSHLNIQTTTQKVDEAIPWWLAVVIAVPLVFITVAVIKIVLIFRDKRARQKQQQYYNKLKEQKKDTI